MTTTTAQDKYNETLKTLNELNELVQSLAKEKEAFAQRQSAINELAAQLAKLRSDLTADKAKNRDDTKAAKDLRKDAERAFKAAKREAEREAKRAEKAKKKSEGKAKTEAKGKAKGRAWNEGTLCTEVLADLCGNYGLRQNMTKAEYDTIRKAYLIKNHPDMYKENKDLQDAMCRWASNHINAFWAKSRFYTKPEYRKAA